MPAPTKALCLRKSEKTHPGKETAQAQQNEHRQLDLELAGGHLRTDAGPEHQEEHEPAQQLLPDGKVEEAETAPQEKDRRNGHATLLDFEDDAAYAGVLKAQAQRQPQCVKQPGSGPDGEILTPRVTVEVEEKSDQNPDAQQRNHQCCLQVSLLGEH